PSPILKVGARRNGDKCMKVAQPNALTKQTIFFHKRC
ncbi:hypothetical protein LTSEWAN_2575, partial [Salmonella enterica subsp. enterica serovar Wandsworth str. A4-580]